MPGSEPRVSRAALPARRASLEVSARLPSSADLTGRRPTAPGPAGSLRRTSSWRPDSPARPPHRSTGMRRATRAPRGAGRRFPRVEHQQRHRQHDRGDQRDGADVAADAGRRVESAGPAPYRVPIADRGCEGASPGGDEVIARSSWRLATALPAAARAARAISSSVRLEPRASCSIARR